MREKQIIDGLFWKLEEDFDSMTFDKLKDIINDIRGDLSHSRLEITEDSWCYAQQVLSILKFDVLTTSFNVIKDRIKDASTMNKYIKWKYEM